MKVLIIGSGGREHALAWKIAQSQKLQCVYVAPGNGGTEVDPKMQNVPIRDIQELKDWALAKSIDLTVVGPEGPLSEGVVDVFRDAGLRIVGPTRAAAQLESSKAFSKAFMKRHRIPTAEFETFTDAALAHAHVDRVGAPIVVKADGLAAGKGVVVAHTLQEAHEAIDLMLHPNTQAVVTGSQVSPPGEARVVIETFLEGEEASFMVLCHGLSALPLATSQDHKRLLDADLGPNTGGMGAYSPAPVVTPGIHAKVMREIITPTLKGMMSEGMPFTGFLYAGLMISPQGQVHTLEFNTRLGDPETQPMMMRLKSDWFEVLWAASADPHEPHPLEPYPSLGMGHSEVMQSAHPLDDLELVWDRRVSLGVVMAAAGYPQAPRAGDVIASLPPGSETTQIFHAGTRREGDHWLTSGGRVLCVCALGESVHQASQMAYALVEQIHFEGEQHRRDIGWRAKS
jgi:phosphoribosylamine---glycine ligase